MKVCFVDEAGDLGALANPPLPNDQPVLVVGGLFADTANIQNLTNDFLNLKQRYFPGLNYPSANHLDRILPEIKGADIRRNAARGTARQQRHAVGFLDRIMGLLQQYDVKLVARIWVKGIGLPFDATPVYTSSIQGICTFFDHYMTQIGDIGICIADSRNSSRISASPIPFLPKSSARRPGTTGRSQNCPLSGTARTTPAFKSAISSAPPCSTRSPASPIAPVTLTTSMCTLVRPDSGSGTDRS